MRSARALLLALALAAGGCAEAQFLAQGAKDVSGSANGPHVHVEYRRRDPGQPCGYRIIDPRLAFG